MHLLHSDELELLDTSMSQAEVEALVAGVNEVWAQAKIRFELEGVVEEQALAVAEYAALIEDTPKGKADKPAKGTREYRQLRQRKGRVRNATLPQDQRIARGIDVYVHRALISAGGVFSCGSRSVVFGQYKAGPKQKPNSAPILAHELGHALSLAHVPCAEGAT